MQRNAAAAVVLGLVAITLTGCAATPLEACRTQPHAEVGGVSSFVTASGDFGSEPTVEFPLPLTTTTTSSSVLIEGAGEPIDTDQQIVTAYTILNGRTGESLGSLGYDGSEPLTQVVGALGVPGIVDGLTCALPGSRVAVAVPGDEGLPAEALPPGTEADDTLVFVFDIERAALARAEGSPRVVPDGFPAVVLAPDGRPGVTVPSDAPPTEVRTATSIQGDGDVLTEEDTAVVHFTGVVWEDNSVFQSTWEGLNGQGASPTQFPLAEDTGLLAGFRDALVGARVGSQILIILPPDAAYGDQQQAGIPAGSTLFFVVDVLGRA